MKKLKNKLCIALMVIGSYTMTKHSTQSLQSTATEAVASMSTQSMDSTVSATEAKTALPF